MASAVNGDVYSARAKDAFQDDRQSPGRDTGACRIVRGLGGSVEGIIARGIFHAMSRHFVSTFDFIQTGDKRSARVVGELDMCSAL